MSGSPAPVRHDDIPALVDVKFMTVAEVAAVLRVSKMTVYRLIRTGELDSACVGGCYRVPESAVNELLRTATGRGARPVQPQHATFHPPAAAAELGAWLRTERTRRGYSVADMARRLRTAGMAMGCQMPAVALMAAYVRLYEHGDLIPVGQHRELYSQELERRSGSRQAVS